MDRPHRPRKRSEYIPPVGVQIQAAQLVEMTLKQLGLKEQLEPEREPKEQLTNAAGVHAESSTTLKEFLEVYLEYNEVASAIAIAQVRAKGDDSEVVRLSELEERLKEDFTMERQSAEYAPFKSERVLPKIQEAFEVLAAGTPLSLTRKKEVIETLTHGIMCLQNIAGGIKVKMKEHSSTGENGSDVQSAVLQASHEEDMKNYRNELGVLQNLHMQLAVLMRRLAPGIQLE